MPEAAPTAAEPDESDPTRRGRDLTVGSIPRHLLGFSMPMLMGAFLQNAYAIVNGVWVGHGLGEEELAAVTVTMPVHFLLVSLAIGLTNAASILVSQAYGARDWDQVRRVVRNSVVLVGVSSCALLVVGICLAGWGLELIRTPPEILEMSTSYLKLFLWTLPLGFGFFLLASFLRGAGDSATPLYFQAVAVGLATLLDPILMFGWLGCPALGVNGTAWSSIAAQAVGLLGLAIWLQRKRHVVAPDWLRLGADWPTTVLTLRIGIPSMIQMSIISLTQGAIMGVINSFGTAAASGFGAAMRVETLALLPALTIGGAISSLAGQNIGARRYDRVSEVFRWGIALCGTIMVVVVLLAETMPGLLVRAFVNESDVVAVGVSYLRIVGAGYLLFSFFFVSNGVINGAGHTLATTLISLTALWGVRVPLAWHMSGPRAMDRIEGVWYAILISSIVGLSLSLGYYYSGLWKRAIGRPAAARLEAPDADGPADPMLLETCAEDSGAAD